MDKFKFSQDEKDKIKATVAELEKNTAGELVLYFARKSDNYPGAGWKFSAIVGMVLATTIVTPPMLRALFAESKKPPRDTISTEGKEA